MKLILKDASIAAVFGLPQEDCEYDAAVKSLVGWTERNARKHIDYAISAGAYEPDGQKPPTVEKPKGKIDLANGVDNYEARLVGQTLAARKEKLT